MARREVADRGLKPIRKDRGPSNNDNLRSCRSGNWPTHLIQRVTSARRTVVEWQKIRPPGRTGTEATSNLTPKLGRPPWRSWTTPREIQKRLRSDREWDRKQCRPKGWFQREESAQKRKRNRPNLHSDRGPQQPRPRRCDPIAKVVHHMGEENPQ